jgi:hypothetical protein
MIDKGLGIFYEHIQKQKADKMIKKPEIERTY